MLPFSWMNTTSGGVSVAPALVACDDSGSARRSDACGFLKVVVTIKKISTTISTSIIATMMTAGGLFFLRMKNRMSVPGLPAILPPEKFRADAFHLNREPLDFFVVI